MPGLAVACHGKGCGWIRLWQLLWHDVHWWAILIMPVVMVAVAFTVVLIRELLQFLFRFLTGRKGNDA